MPRLRMKDSKSTDEAVLSAQHRAARKSRHKHRRRSPSESLNPPRTRPKTSSAPDDWGFDESSLPPEQAYKRSRTDDEFLESLADAEAQDQGVGYHEEELYSRQMPSYSTHYSSAAGAAAGIDLTARKGDYLAAMDEEEYAEYVRAGIWRMRNREEVERRERMEKERRQREEREKRENEKRDREERDRIRKLEERRKRKSKEDEEGAKKRYEEAWRRLQQPTSAPSTKSSSTADPASSSTDPPPSASSSTPVSPYPLRFTDFPWPLYPPLALPPLSWPSISDFTAPAVSSFLLDGVPPDKHKAVLRQAVLAYHPDRFERLVARVPEEKEDVRERVRELGLRVSQVLNEVMKQRA